MIRCSVLETHLNNCVENWFELGDLGWEKKCNWSKVFYPQKSCALNCIVEAGAHRKEAEGEKSSILSGFGRAESLLGVPAGLSSIPREPTASQAPAGSGPGACSLLCASSSASRAAAGPPQTAASAAGTAGPLLLLLLFQARGNESGRQSPASGQWRPHSLFPAPALVTLLCDNSLF